MAAGRVATINLLYIIFLIVPGLVGIKGFLLVRRETDNYGRIETVVFSLIISILSVLLLYAGYSVYLWELVDFSDVANFGLPNIILIFLLHSAICSILGTSIGIGNNIAEKREWISGIIESLPYVDGEDARMEVWDFVFEEIHSNSAVAVITEQGHVVSGNVVQSGDKIQERDLILSRPSLKLLTDNGDYVDEDLPNKTYAYVHNQDISQILLEEDLNHGDEKVAEDMGIDQSEELDDLSDVLEEYEDWKITVREDETRLESRQIEDDDD